MKTAAVVVTYNRRKLLFEQIEDVVYHQSYKVDRYYIIDNNSSDDTEECVKVYQRECPIEIKYCRMSENIGGAGGFYYGLKYAYDDGYDWIILMDDDGKPYDRGCFHSAFSYIKKKELSAEDAYLINSLVLYDDTTLSFSLNHSDSIEEIKKFSMDTETIINLVNPFNGTFISRGLIHKIGFPNKEFFIKGDEYDYVRRALSANAEVFTLLNSRYFHPKLLDARNKRILGRKVYVHIEAPWKEYYITRNYVYSAKSLHKNKDARLYLALRIFCAFYCKCKKVETLKMIFRGYLDGKKGRLGVRVKI